MSGAAVVLLDDELFGPEAAAAFAVAQRVAGDDVRTLVLTPEAPAGDLPALGSLEVGVLPGGTTADGDTWFAGVRELVGEPPPIIVFAVGELSEAVAARLAGALGFTPVVDVECVEVQDDALIIERSAFGGKASHRLRAEATGLIVATVGNGDAATPPPIAPRLVRPIAPAAGPLTGTTHVSAPPAGLQAARVIVAGGRGVGESGFREVEELAGRLGAAVGASRGAVDAGWARPEQQVGLTGQVVSPEVYLAVGISGASQHLVGMSRSRTVLAINTDQAAPMADAADVAFVVDWHAVWPSLQELLMAERTDG